MKSKDWSKSKSLLKNLMTMKLNQIEIPCPLCLGTKSTKFHSDKSRDYFRCPDCHLIHVPPHQYLTDAAEKKQYDLHENNPDDPGYRQFLNRVASPLLERLNKGSKGLDFGCGPGPTLSLMMQEAGHRVALYDLFYHPDSHALTADYDFITATEVIEHLANPNRELDRLWSLLNPGGWLAIMTKRATNLEGFKNWHYKADPTHISFYSENSFLWLGKKWGSSPIFIDKDVVFFQKEL